LVVDYEPLGSIRARVAGFANHIHVTEGQHVEAGQLLVALENPELESELSSLLIDVAISELRIKSLLTAGEITSVQLERENLVSLKKRRDELQRLIGSLHVVASQPGTVIASELDSMLGTYVRPGDELLSVGQPGEIQALALARQQDLPWLKANERSPVRLFLWGQPQTSWLTGTVRRINPRARDDVPHDAFAASNGGPLAVVPRDQVEGATEDGQQDMMLTEPRVPVEISLSESDRANLSAGQVGTMLIRGRDQNMASYLAGNFVRFIRKNNFRTHGL
jgi:putative peptide zinc metalloprotease protein